MARTAKDYDVRTKTARLRLAARPKPYCRQAGAKRLGYIRNDDRNGTWLAVEGIPGTKRIKTRVLGQADDYTGADGQTVLTFDQAMQRATNPAPLAPAGRLTVTAALDRYFGVMAARSKHAEEYRRAAKKHIDPVLGGHRIDHLTKTQIEAWLAGLVRDDPEDDDVRRRSQDTANRILTHLKAALNSAFQDEANRIDTDAAWRRVRPFQKVSRAREVDLEPAQVRALITAAATFDQALANLIEAGYLTGARMGELAGLDVRHFNRGDRQLHLDGKTGQRTATLTQEATGFFSALAKDKKPTDALLPMSDGERWRRSGHHRSIKRAVAAAELAPDVCFYTLRHAHISRAIEAGMPLSLIAENCGTSLLMIQKNYAKVLARTRSSVIEKTAPKLRLVKGART